MNIQACVTEDIISDEDLEAANKVADVLIDKTLAAIAEKGVDEAAVLYAMWVDITQMLAAAGWTADQLTRDVQWHAAEEVGGLQ